MAKPELALASPSAAIGDPTVALGAGMFDLSTIPAARITATTSKLRGRNVGDIPRADAAYDRGQRARVELDIYDVQKDVILALLSNAMDVGSGIDFDTSYRKENPPTLAIIPRGHEVGAITSPKVWWITAASQDGDVVFAYEDGEGNEGNSVHTIAFEALLRDEDQDEEAIPNGKQVIFQNVPPAGWTLPPAYDAPPPP